jgi:dihydrodipicolinate synthase
MSVFKGVGVALITPFDNGGINFDAFGRIIDYVTEGGADAICVCGTTGEPPTMSAEEKQSAIKFAIKKAAGRLPVIAGCGCNSTEETIKNALEAEALGADALLIVTPYYNKCTQAGIIAHYSAVAEKVNVPIIMYNVPSRTGVNILPETALKLSGVKNIAAIKEASGNALQLQELLRLAENKLDVYLGDDSLTYIGMTLGAKGVISVAANVTPELMKNITDSAFSCDWTKAREQQFALSDLIKNLFSEVNPIPVKKAMNLLGFDAGVPRLPLTEMEPQNAEKLEKAMRALKLIN